MVPPGVVQEVPPFWALLRPERRSDHSWGWCLCSDSRVWYSAVMRWKRERFFSPPDEKKNPFHCSLPSDLINGCRVGASLMKGIAFVWVESPGAERTREREEAARGSGQHSDVAS